MLNLVLAESALELIPVEIRKSPSVVSDSKRRGMEPSSILLDRSYHHSAMLKLMDGEKRGRPDLIHVSLLNVTCTPLYLDGGVRLYVHTCNDKILEIEPKTRIPKSYMRFRGLIEKALCEEPSRGLVKVYPGRIGELVKKVISPGTVVGLSVQGRPSTAEAIARELVSARNPCALVGGFPHGHFSENTVGLVAQLERIDPRPLEAHVVVSRLVYEVEKAQKTNQ